MSPPASKYKYNESLYCKLQMDSQNAKCYEWWIDLSSRPGETLLHISIILTFNRVLDFDSKLSFKNISRHDTHFQKFRHKSRFCNVIVFNIETRSTSPPTPLDVKAYQDRLTFKALFFHVQMGRGGWGGAGRGALNLFGQCPYGNNTFKKSRNGDTLGPVELILWREQGNQGDWREQDDQGEASIYHHILNE